MSQFLPASESQRLTELEQYHILNTPPESAFDELVDLATHISETPIALISFIDTDRQWIKAKVGIDYSTLPREHSFCTHTIGGSDSLIVVDAIHNDNFATLPIVAEKPNIRFYAGVPLMTPQGSAIGTLSVMDYKPRELSASKIAALYTLGHQVMAQLELRRFTIKPPSTAQSPQSITDDDIQFRQVAEHIKEVFWITDPAKQQMIYISPAYEQVWGRTCESLYSEPTSFLDAIHPEDRDRVIHAFPKQTQGTYEEEYRVVRPDGNIRWVEDRAVPIRNQQGQVYRVVGIAIDITSHKQHKEALQSRESILQAVGFTGALLLGHEPLEQSIPAVLEQLGAATQVSRIYIFKNHYKDNNQLLTSQNYEWVTSGIKSEIDNPELQEFSYEEAGFARWPAVLKERNIIVGNIHDFPESEQPVLHAQNIRSVVIVPIFVEAKWWGLIGFDECNYERVWHESELEVLKMAANLIGAAIQQRNVETERSALQQQVIDAQQASIRELSTPLIPLTDRVILMPLIGAIDHVRAQFILETLLTGVADHQAELVILDITGVQLVDTYIANTIVRAAQAVKLLGAQVMMTGIQPQIAQTLVQLGIDLNNILTRGTLQDGIAFALENINIRTSTV